MCVGGGEGGYAPCLSETLAVSEHGRRRLKALNDCYSNKKTFLSCRRVVSRPGQRSKPFLFTSTAAETERATAMEPRYAEMFLNSRHVTRFQKDPKSWIPRIQDLRSRNILDLIFLLSLGILEILDPVTATMPWDPRDLEFRAEKTLFWDPGSSLYMFSWDLADLET